MRILSLHNRYQIKGGEDESHLAEVRLLELKGHQVDCVIRDNQDVERLGPVRTGLEAIWSVGSYEQVKDLLKEHQHDLVHVQNFFPLISPSIYYAAASLGVPVVQTLRNYRLLCLNGLFFRDGGPCEDCLGTRHRLPGVSKACYRSSRVASAAVATMLTVHDGLGTWRTKVSAYIALTDFAREKFVQGGLPPTRLHVKPNFLLPDPGPGDGEGDFAIFVGRLSEEKGVRTLLDAWEGLSERVKLQIVGDGPLLDLVRERAAMLPNVSVLGNRQMEEVLKLIGSARYMVFPSNNYEGMPRTVIEAFAKGTPVVASNLGATSTMIEDGKNGFLFQAGNAESLRSRVEQLAMQPSLANVMRSTARADFEEKYSANRNYEQLMTIYEEARLVARAEH